MLFASLLSFFTTLFIYYYHGMMELSTEVYNALIDVFVFWFPIFWSLGIILALFRGMKYIFNECIKGFEFKLLSCQGSETIDIIGYGDLIKVWRRWLMLNIWLVGSFMILALIYTELFTSFNEVFEWFNIYWLYSFILFSGYLSFIIIGTRCKKIKIARC